MKYWLFSALILVTTTAYGTSKVVGVSGSSAYVTSTANNTTTQTVYGGTGGSLTGCEDNNDGYTCNNCKLNSYSGFFGFGTICNETRIVPGKELVIAVTSSTTGPLSIFNSSTNARIGNAGDTILSANGTGNIRVPWSAICLAYTSGNATCEFAGTQAFYVGVDKDGNGIKDGQDDVVSLTIVVNNLIGGNDYTVAASTITTNPGDAIYPIAVQAGDEKVYISSFTPGGSVTSGLAPFIKYRLYFSNAAIAIGSMIEMDSLGSADFKISGTGSDVSLSPDYVDGLENGVQYFFVGAHVDQSGNIGYFTDPGTLPLDAIPDFVYGLLSKDFECFVATATFGTPDAKEVITLRRFRNYLMQYHRDWAQPLIKFYYAHSPKLAAFIRDNEFLKTISRIILWPPIQFAKISLKHGMSYALMIFLLPILLLTILFRRWNAQARRR
jgi:hypothetical protein